MKWEQSTVDLLRRYDRPGPRYTSYPTAVEFTEEFDREAYEARLARADRETDRPLSLYLHIPFCEERCHYCGCNVVITRHREVAARYLEALCKEIDLLAARLPHRRQLAQYHWGGGTPTYLEPEQIEALDRHVRTHFTVLPDAEVAIEVDPRVTDRRHLDVLRRLGFNRISFGVQDLSPEVQDAIGRRQTEYQTRELYQACRKVGFGSINFDLIYGLPHQTVASFRESVEKVIDMRPDRLAVYSYAHVPWMRPNQKKMDADAMPDAELKLRLFGQARDQLLGAGYVAIGMDHFALPDDELVRATSERRLHRNFMGYTVKRGGDMVGVGISAIGDLGSSFAQNERKLSRYHRAIDEGRLPVERGYLLDEDDRIRREVILQLMCNFHLAKAEIERRFGIGFDTYFAGELEELRQPGGPVAEGLVELRPDSIEVVGPGKMIVRNVCMTFDRYLRAKRPEAHIFSRTV